MSYSCLNEQVPDNDASCLEKMESGAQLDSNLKIPNKSTDLEGKSKVKQVTEVFKTNKTIAMEGWNEVAKDLKHPWGMSVASDGTLAVAEWGSNSITLIDSKQQTRELLSFTELVNPRAVAFTNDGHLLASDTNTIYKLTREGRIVKTASGAESFGFSSPAGIAVHPHSGLIYVANTENHCILVLATDLTHIGSFGKLGKEEGDLCLPWDITFDSQGDVFIADGNNRVQHFTPQGKFIGSFGEGQLDRPSSITIDKSDCIYVTELYRNRVSVFTTAGKHLYNIACKGERELNGPCGIAYIGNRLFITDCYNNRVVSVDIGTMT